MGSICPKDGTACPDDLCHGSGCMAMGGYPMLERCAICSGFINDEMLECSTCTCDDEEWLSEDDLAEGERARAALQEGE